MTIVFHPSEKIGGFYNSIIKLSAEEMPSQRWEINFIFCFLSCFSSLASCLFFSPTGSTDLKRFSRKHQKMRTLIPWQETMVPADSKPTAVCQQRLQHLRTPANPRIKLEDSWHGGTSSPVPWPSEESPSPRGQPA